MVRQASLRALARPPASPRPQIRPAEIVKPTVSTLDGASEPDGSFTCDVNPGSRPRPACTVWHKKGLPTRSLHRNIPLFPLLYTIECCRCSEK